MPTNIITFKVNDRDARAGFNRLKREVDQLDSEFKDTRSEAERTRRAIDQLGDEARESGREIDRLSGHFRDTNSRLRDVRGQFVTAGQDVGTLTRSLDGLKGVFAGLGIADAGREILQFGASAVQAAEQMEGLRRGLQAIEGSNADQRLRDFNSVSEFAIRLADINTEIQRYETLLARAREEVVGQTNPAIQQLERRLTASRAAAAALTREIEPLKNGFQDFVPPETTQTVTNYTLELEKLKTVAEDTRRGLTETSDTNPQLIPNFAAALAASNDYYAERIRQAEAALAKEKAGTDAFNARQVEIFQLGHQRLAAQRQLETERTNLLQTFTTQRVSIEREANNAVIAGFSAVTQAAAAAARAHLTFAQQIAATPDINSPDAQYGNFTSQLRQDFADTEQQGQSLLDVMRQIVSLSVAPLDLDARIPDPDLRQQQIDERIAAEARGQQTIISIRQDALEQGSQFLNGILRDEQRDIQRSINAQARQYRQFANLVSNTFLDLVTGRARNFESVATTFIQQSLRIVARAFIEHQIRLRLDDTLTAHKIANIQKVNAAQSAASAGGNLGGIPGLANLPGLGNLASSLSGGGAALGVSALLFPEQIKNLAGGITDTISNLLSNVASAPDQAFAPQQVFLKIGDNEVRDISDMQDELRQENRA